MNSRSFDKIIWYSSSEAEPKARLRNRANCGCVFRPQPSAILEGIEEEDRLIWLVRP